MLGSKFDQKSNPHRRKLHFSLASIREFRLFSMHVKGQAATYAGPLPGDVGGKRAIEQITRAIKANERTRLKWLLDGSHAIGIKRGLLLYHLCETKSVEFEYDPAKNEMNMDKHGIDFENAKALWNDPRALLIELGYKDEKRFALIAELGESKKLWTAIFTKRSEKIRIISVRRARQDEGERYEKEQSEDR